MMQCCAGISILLQNSLLKVYERRVRKSGSKNFSDFIGFLLFVVIKGSPVPRRIFQPNFKGLQIAEHSWNQTQVENCRCRFLFLGENLKLFRVGCFGCYLTCR